MRTRVSLPLGTLATMILGCASAAQLTVRDGESIQSAINRAGAGDTVLVMPGTYHETVFIDKDNLRLVGVIRHDEWPILDGRNELHDGILVSGHGVTIENMYVRRYQGNGIMTQGGNNFRILRNRVEGPSFYGIFPQFGDNGLVEGNTVWKVDDAGIYAGICQHVDIIGNESHDNVIGIETENSHQMLVQGNYVHDNSSGIIVTLIPGLPVKSASDTIVRDNFIVHNNTANFAPPGAITADVPSGTGMLIYAASRATIESNIIRDNQSVGILVADQAFIPGPPDPKEEPYPNDERILANVFLDNGAKPQGVIGSMLAAIGQSVGPDILTTGKGHGSCLSDRAAARSIGTDSWSDCRPGTTTAAIVTARLARPPVSPPLTRQQLGRLTYLAVCSGCHSYTNRLVGPPMVTIQAIFHGRAQALADWIAAPKHVRPDYPEMPPQNYLTPQVRLAVAQYILNQLRP
jgi:parallel beta-helix repeat protein